MKALGATVIEDTSFVPPTNNGSTVLSYEFQRDLNAYLASLGSTAPIKSLAEVDQFIQNYLIVHPDPNHTGPFKYGDTLV